MAFNADVIVMTQPGSTGQQTYSLASNFDPKAVIVWATPQTANGSIAHYNFGVGMGTYRGSVVQQRYVSMKGRDAATSGTTARSCNSNSLLALLIDTSGVVTKDLEIDLISMQTGATSQVVLDWVNLFTTASIRVFMLVLGGSDITDALVDDVTLGTGSTTQDETVVAGFGKPELVFFDCNIATAFTDGVEASANISFGFAKQGEAGRCSSFNQLHGNTASLTGMRQRSDRCFTIHTDALDRALGRLDTTVSNWPTDGFRMLFDANPTAAYIIPYLALRTTAQITTGATLSPATAIAQDNACGFVPKLGLLFGWNIGAFSTLVTADSLQCGWGLGAYDGTDEAWAGFTEDDALGTMDSNSQQTIAKVFRQGSQDGTEIGAADGSFSGNNFRLTHTTAAGFQCEYQWLAIGDAAVAATEIPLVTMARW